MTSTPTLTTHPAVQWAEGRPAELLLKDARAALEANLAEVERIHKLAGEKAEALAEVTEQAKTDASVASQKRALEAEAAELATELETAVGAAKASGVAIEQAKALVRLEAITDKAQNTYVPDDEDWVKEVEKAKHRIDKIVADLMKRAERYDSEIRATARQHTKAQKGARQRGGPVTVKGPEHSPEVLYVEVEGKQKTYTPNRAMKARWATEEAVRRYEQKKREEYLEATKEERERQEAEDRRRRQEYFEAQRMVDRLSNKDA